MTEVMIKRNNRSDTRRLLLATASAAALLVSVGAMPQADAANNDATSPPLWLELGGQFAAVESDQDAFLPPFTLTTPRPPFETVSLAGIEKPPPSSWDGSARIVFEPAGAGWVFSAGILYGKSSSDRTSRQQTAHLSPTRGTGYRASQNVTAKSSQSHAILDFRAGRDVGLGLFGNRGSSIVSLGLRYAQFSSQSSNGIISRPTNANYTHGYYQFFGTLIATRKSTNIGPSLSWDASTALIGEPAGGQIAVDWGVTGAILFGRQTVRGHHQTKDVFRIPNLYANGRPTYQHSASPDRSKQVMVPNLGGFAGVSWRYPNAKVSLGYRADFFFGAMDGGIDTAKKENVGFYGPFASVSVGIGG